MVSRFKTGWKFHFTVSIKTWADHVCTKTTSEKLILVFYLSYCTYTAISIIENDFMDRW